MSTFPPTAGAACGTRSCGKPARPPSRPSRPPSAAPRPASAGAPSCSASSCPPSSRSVCSPPPCSRLHPLLGKKSDGAQAGHDPRTDQHRLRDPGRVRDGREAGSAHPGRSPTRGRRPDPQPPLWGRGEGLFLDPGPSPPDDHAPVPGRPGRQRPHGLQGPPGRGHLSSSSFASFPTGPKRMWSTSGSGRTTRSAWLPSNRSSRSSNPGVGSSPTGLYPDDVRAEIKGRGRPPDPDRSGHRRPLRAPALLCRRRRACGSRGTGSGSRRSSASRTRSTGRSSNRGPRARWSSLTAAPPSPTPLCSTFSAIGPRSFPSWSWPTLSPASAIPHPVRRPLARPSCAAGTASSVEVGLASARVMFGGREALVLSVRDLGGERRPPSRRDLENQNLIGELQASLLFLREPIASCAVRPLFCELRQPVSSVAARMTAEDASAAVVMADGEAVGILTDRDIRARLVAEGKPSDRPVHEFMSVPAGHDRTERPGLRGHPGHAREDVDHLLVRDENGRVAGLLRNRDLLLFPRFSPAVMTQEIRGAPSVEAMAEARRPLAKIIGALVRGGVKARNVTRAVTAVTDASSVRLIELAEAGLGPPPVRYAFLALGSQGREEQTLATDQDHALLLEDYEPAREPEVAGLFLGLGRSGQRGLVPSGLSALPGQGHGRQSALATAPPGLGRDLRGLARFGRARGHPRAAGLLRLPDGRRGQVPGPRAAPADRRPSGPRAAFPAALRPVRPAV